MLPLLVPNIATADEILPFLRRIDNARQYTNFGPLSRELEDQLAPVLGVEADGRHCVSLANATLGLELSLLASGLRRDARVLVPSITFVATGTAVVRAGFTPIFSDVDRSSWQITPAIALRIHAEQPIEAVLVVAVFGYAVDSNAWDNFSRDTGIRVIVDAAGALGAQKCGAASTVVVSLHATKVLGAGEGALVASRDPNFIQRVKALANFGLGSSGPHQDLVALGTNAKLSEYHAAVALASIPRWQGAAMRREAIHAEYVRLFQSKKINFELPTGGLVVRTMFVAFFPQVRDADDMIRFLGSLGMGARRWYCPKLPSHSAFAKFGTHGDLVSAKYLERGLIGLPFFLDITALDQLRVVNAVFEYFERQ